MFSCSMSSSHSCFCITLALVVVWSVHLTTRLVRGGSAPAQGRNEPQQLAQADQTELRITAQLLGLLRPVGIRPAPRELHRRAICKPDHDADLAGR
jgi:hypothetical protein